MSNYEKLITEVFISEAVDTVSGCLRDLPDPRASFDLGRMDYVVPKTALSQLRGASRSIAVRALEVYASSVRAEIEAEVRASLINRLTRPPLT